MISLNLTRRIVCIYWFLLLPMSGVPVGAAEVDSIVIRGQTIKVGTSWQEASKVLKNSDQLGQDNTWERSLPDNIQSIKYYRVDGTAFSVALRLQKQLLLVARVVLDDPKINGLEREPICIKPYANPGFLNNYSGAINETLPIQLTLSFVDSEGRLEGVYFYTKHLKDIRLSGVMENGRNVVLNELDEGGATVAVFKGSFQRWDPRGRYTSILACEVLTGVWERVGGTVSLPFYLSMASATGGSLDSRYAVAGASDDVEVEANAQAFWMAVKKYDKRAVARLIAYPMIVQVGGRRENIPDEETLLKSYDKIFTKAFRKAILATTPHNMFANYSGIMLGSGIVWFGSNGKVIVLNKF